MTEQYRDIIRCHSRPLAPIPTGEEPMLRELEGIAAVLFDVYGTLFISASGDVEASGRGRAKAFRDAFTAVGVTAGANGEIGVACLLETIKAQHEAMRQNNVCHPEVDIVEIWRRTLEKLYGTGWISSPPRDIDLKRLAVEYEVRANPIWPMPHLLECLRAIRDAGLALGIISNAQFYVIDMFSALLGKSPDALGFDPWLQLYSYRHERAKPGQWLYRKAKGLLGRRGITAREALYVGNDMLNDVQPASLVGFRTALFAGDARSFRRRENDPRVGDLSPDLILTDLVALPRCIGIS